MQGMNIKIIIVGPFRDYPKAPKQQDTHQRIAIQTNETKGPGRSKERQRFHTVQELHKLKDANTLMVHFYLSRQNLSLKNKNRGIKTLIK